MSVFARAASRGGKSTTPLICRVDSMLPPWHSSSLQAPSSLQVQTAFLSHVGLAVASPTPRSGVKEIVKDLPDLWLLSILAWGRLAFSLTGIVLGCLLAAQRESFFKSTRIWAISSLIFGVFAIIFS